MYFRSCTGGPLHPRHYHIITLTQDDLYGAYFFPKGTTFISNAWKINRCEEYYNLPDNFLSDRFLKHPYGLRTSKALVTAEERKNSGRKALEAFGSGRRQCAGEQFSLTTILLAELKVVWAFDVSPPDAGVDISNETGYKDAQSQSQTISL